VFFQEHDREFYLQLLIENAKKAGVSFWAYCLMDNHVHLIAVPKTPDAFAKGFSETHRKYTRMINQRYEWKGHLWQGRFFSCPLDEAHLYAAVRYVERNPVRAGIVSYAEEYYWSSARSHVFGFKEQLLTDFYLMSFISNWKLYLRENENESQIKALRSHSRTGRPLGNDEFIKRIETISGRTIRKKKPGRKKKED
jgi:putative transposase